MNASGYSRGGSVTGMCLRQLQYSVIDCADVCGILILFRMGCPRDWRDNRLVLGLSAGWITWIRFGLKMSVNAFASGEPKMCVAVRIRLVLR